jgi:hypothetical protein
MWLKGSIVVTFIVMAVCAALIALTPTRGPEMVYTERSAPTSSPDMSEYQTKYMAMYESDGEDDPLDIQCPIPPKDRVPNYTGVQCVWSSIETLGRWCDEPKLVNPPLTSYPDCKGGANPESAAHKLKQLNVKFEQVYGDREAGLVMIRKAMAEGRGCAFGVPHHVMTLVHFDEKADVVKWVDNVDSKLRVQTTTVAKFHQMWRSWVLVIYPDKDNLQFKLGRSEARNIPIVDRNGKQEKYPKDYIPLPHK